MASQDAGARAASVSRWSPVRGVETTNGFVAPNATDPRGLPTRTTSHPDVPVSRADHNLGGTEILSLDGTT